jgi:peptidoglycan L-alanyl-D-glutamate endopeptidase CwlK
MINSRLLIDLLPPVAALAQHFLDNCLQEGIDLLITSTYRDMESQAVLYAQGRTTPGRIITNARPGQSYHNYRVAFDWVPIVNGKPRWDEPDLFHTCGNIAEGVGLEWAGHWTTFPEMVHCQFTGGLILADFQAGKTLTSNV